MAERSFAREVEQLRMPAGQVFRGEGILAVTKALLQAGVSYVGGYQGAPVSHMMDVLNDARDIMDELGVHIETNANEAGAAAMLGASINYPVRGAVTWKSIVGTNVAADALSNLSSPGVTGGALIIVGEDYGEGASVIQERTHAGEDGAEHGRDDGAAGGFRVPGTARALDPIRGNIGCICGADIKRGRVVGAGEIANPFGPGQVAGCASHDHGVAAMDAG